MQPAGDRADQLGKAALDVEVDVLKRAREGEVAFLDFGRDLVQPACDLGRFCLR